MGGLNFGGQADRGAGRAQPAAAGGRHREGSTSRAEWDCLLWSLSLCFTGTLSTKSMDMMDDMMT
jgi:hypothetical protein